MTTVYASLKVTSVVFDPQPASAVATNALYYDSSGNALSTKGSSGSGTAIGPSGGGVNPFVKTAQNTGSVEIPAGELVAKTLDGGIGLASSDTAGQKLVIGTAAAAIAPGASGQVNLLGPNQAGVLAGLGFNVGDSVFMGEGSGLFTNDITTLAGGDRVVRVGIADCASGSASPTVTDLLCVLTEEVADQT